MPLDDDLIKLIRETAKNLNISIEFVEKDFYVFQFLKRLFAEKTLLSSKEELHYQCAPAPYVVFLRMSISLIPKAPSHAETNEKQRNPYWRLYATSVSY